MFHVTREDKSYFFADNGSGKEIRIAKNGLSVGKVSAWQRLCNGGVVKAKKMADGGEVKPYRLKEESDDAFTVEDEGGPFRIARAGLSPALMERIRGYADGGEVATEAPILTGDPETDALLSARAEAAPPAPAIPTALPAVPVMDIRTGRPVTLAPAPIPAASGPTPEAAAALDALLASRGAVPEAVTMVPSHGTAAQVEPATLAAHSTGPGVPSPVAAPVAPTSAPAPAPAFTVPGAPNVSGELAAGRAQQARAFEQQAQVAQAEGQRQAEILAETEKRRAAAQADYTARLNDLQAKGDALYQNILDKKVDPRRLWNSSGTGRQITASIGMILGGIGSALTGGPNYAVEIMDRAIQRDIESQKSEIDKGQNLLAHNLRRTDDLRAAHQLTRADLLDSSAAQLQAASASFTGEKAKAAAVGAIGNLRAEAAKERQAVAATAMQMAATRELLPLQVEQAKRQAAMQRLQMEAMGKLFSGVGSPFDPRAMALLPEDIRERVVQLPGGNATMAPTKEEAAKVRDQITGMLDVKAAVVDMRRQRKEMGRAWLPFTGEGATGKSQRAQLVGALRVATVGPGAMTEKERQIIESMVPESGEVFVSDSAFEARMRQIEQKAQDALWSSLAGRTGARTPRSVVP